MEELQTRPNSAQMTTVLRWYLAKNLYAPALTLPHFHQSQQFSPHCVVAKAAMTRSSPYFMGTPWNPASEPGTLNIQFNLSQCAVALV